MITLFKIPECFIFPKKSSKEIFMIFYIQYVATGMQSKLLFMKVVDKIFPVRFCFLRFKACFSSRSVWYVSRLLPQNIAINKEWYQNKQEQLLPMIQAQFCDDLCIFQHLCFMSQGSSDTEVARRSLHGNFVSVAWQLSVS